MVRYLGEGEGEWDGQGEGRLRDDAELGADEQMVEEQDKFERAYNFRFEEPDQEYVSLQYLCCFRFARAKDFSSSHSSLLKRG